MAQTIKLKRSATAGAAPTTSQLELGEVAINTYDGKMYIKKSVGGTESIVEISGGGGASAADAIFEEYLYTATNNQTAFSGNDDNSSFLSYVSGAIQVFLNGVLLDPETDYTATNGATVTLTSGAATGDYLQIITFKKKIGDGSVTIDTFSGNNSTTAFTLSLDPGDENNTRVFIDGVYQSKSNYTVSGTTLTFSSAPPSGTGIEVEIGNRAVSLDTTSSLDLPDNVQLRLGTDQDMKLYHTGSHGILTSGTGDIRYQSNTRHVFSDVGFSESHAIFNDDGAVNLYNNGNLKFATTSTGVDVTGNIVVSGTVDGRDVAADGATAIAALPRTGGAMTGAITTNSTFDGRNVATDGAKLDGIESGATADQTQSEINALGITATGLSGTPAISVANITTTGELRGPASLVIDPAAVGDNTGTVVIKGNLQVDGATTTINSTTLTVDDLNITLASGAANGTAANGAGITVDGASATITYNSTGDSWDFNKGIDVTGTAAADAFTFDNYTLDSNKIATNQASGYNGDIFLDAAGDIILDADSGAWRFRDNGGSTLEISTGTGTSPTFYSPVSDADIVFKGNDGGSAITALTLDMSNAGRAFFNVGASFSGDVAMGDNNKTKYGQGEDLILYSDGTNGEIEAPNGTLTLDVADRIILDASTDGDVRLHDDGLFYGQLFQSSNNFYIRSRISDGDIIFNGQDGSNFIDALTLDMSDVGTAHFNGHIRLGDNRTASFGAGFDIEITSDGTNGTIGAQNGDLTLDVAGTISFDADGGHILLLDGGTRFANISASSTDLVIQSSVQDRDIFLKGNDGGSVITALTLDMSDAGTAIFNHDAKFSDNAYIKLGAGSDLSLNSDGTNGRIFADNGDLLVDVAGNINLDADGGSVFFKDAGTEFFKIRNTGSDVQIYSARSDADIKIEGVDGGVGITALLLDMSAAGAATFNAGATFAGNVALGSATAGNLQVGSANSFQIQKSGVNAYINQSDSGPIIIRMGSSFTERMRIDSSGKVGIGTSPSFPLEISGEGTVSLAYQRTGTGVTAKKWGFHSDNSNTYWQNITDSLLAVTVSNAGNVGIGTTVPSSILTVDSGTVDDVYTPTAFNDKAQIKIDVASTQNNYAAIQFTHSGNTEGLIGFVRPSTHVNDADFVIQGYSSATSAYAEKMRITDDGRVGIGTDSPAVELHINDTSGLSAIRLTGGASSADNFQIMQGHTGVTNAGFSIYDIDEAATRFVINTSGNATFTGSVTSAGVSSSNSITMSAGNLTLNSTSDGNQAFRYYRADGTLVSQQYPYNNRINFQTYNNQGLRLKSHGTGQIELEGNVVINEDGGDLDFRVESDSDQYALFVRGSDGNVGIGTSSPAAHANLHIAGAPYAFLTLQATNSGGRQYELFSYAADQSFHLYDRTADAYRMTVDETGNVGIGTNSPYGKLQIEGNTNGWNVAPMIVFSSSSTVNSAIRDWAIGPADTSYGYFHINQGASTGASPLATSNVRFTISDTGNVGIGTALPTEKLHVNGAAKIDGNLYLATGSNTPYIVGGQVSTVFRNNANSASRVTILDGGNVGIGTASPGALFDINKVGDGTVARFGLQGVCDWDFSIGNTPTGTNGSSGDLELIPQNGNMGFAVLRAGQSAINMRVRDGVMTVGSGIKFNSDTAAANMLDDYEEGTWTPKIAHNDGTGEIPLTVQSAKYTKIGNVVYVNGYLTAINPNGNAGTSSPYYGIRNFPYTPTNYGVWNLAYASSNIAFYGGYSSAASFYFLLPSGSSPMGQPHVSGTAFNAYGSNLVLMFDAVYIVN